MDENVPEMKPVLSSNVAAVGYDEPSQTMHVQFKSGGHYAYRGVSPTLHADVLNATSVGRHIASRIVGRFKSDKIK